MKRSKNIRNRRGAALIYILALTGILLLLFSTTFQSFHILRQVNAQAITDLQTRANMLRIHRPTTTVSSTQLPARVHQRAAE